MKGYTLSRLVSSESRLSACRSLGCLLVGVSAVGVSTVGLPPTLGCRSIDCRKDNLCLGPDTLKDLS